MVHSSRRKVKTRTSTAMVPQTPGLATNRLTL
jgi:hypothetical protein